MYCYVDKLTECSFLKFGFQTLIANEKDTPWKECKIGVILLDLAVFYTPVVDTTV